MSKHYIVFVRDTLPKPEAHLVWAAHCANGAANLGYSAVLVYLQKGISAHNPIAWIAPFHPRRPSLELQKFYNLKDRLKVSPLPIPWPIDRFKGKWLNSSSLVCKYYFPVHIAPSTQIVHTRNWNFVKAAIQNNIPVIYEHHHYDPKKFAPAIVRHPCFKVAITLSEPVRDHMVQQGMPAEKILKLSSGLNPVFLDRQPNAAKAWREHLLTQECQHLVVYAGALYRFKGVDLLIDVAKQLPQVQFAFAGGNKKQILTYQQLTREKKVANVTFLGYLPQDRLAALLQSADILAHPHCAGEAATFTSPLKFFDYLASGSPIVATEIPPLMDFKSAAVVAGWCEPNQPLQLAHCIQRVLETHPRKAEGNLHNIEFAQQFSWENRIQKILNHVKTPMSK